jgi:ribosomal protein S18 acetylase RimI-like enzyme
MVNIRPYQNADLESIQQLIVELQSYERQFDAERAEPTAAFAARYLSHVLSDVETQAGSLLVAVDGDRICGFAAGYVEVESANEQDYFYIAELVVSEAYHGCGVGSMLVGAMESLARSRGFKRLGISVLVNSERVHELYQRLGFRDYGIDLMKEL